MIAIFSRLGYSEKKKIRWPKSLSVSAPLCVCDRYYLYSHRHSPFRSGLFHIFFFFFSFSLIAIAYSSSPIHMRTPLWLKTNNEMLLFFFLNLGGHFVKDFFILFFSLFLWFTLSAITCFFFLLICDRFCFRHLIVTYHFYIFFFIQKICIVSHSIREEIQFFLFSRQITQASG